MTELTGAELDLAVAKALGLQVRDTTGEWRWHHPVVVRCIPAEGDLRNYEEFQPSTNWAQGGPLIEEHDVHIHKDAQGRWFGHTHKTGAPHTKTGPTPLIAACRAIAASKSKEEV